MLVLPRFFLALLLLSSSLSASALEGGSEGRDEIATAQPTTPPALLLPRQNLPQLPGAAPPVASPSASGSGTGTQAPTVSVPQNAPAGGLYYLEPAQTAAASYYKITPSNPISFVWNFTSLYVQPKSLTFQAYCASNSYTYPVGPATGIPGTATSLVWDPYAYEQSPGAPVFLQASYTLRVFDERGPTAIATAGYFSGQNALAVFAMYSPAVYTPLSAGWTCAACASWSPSLAATLSHPLAVALPVTAALILIGGAGVFRR